jgi:site-specific recombinase XerD
LLHGLQHFSLWAYEAGFTSQELDAKTLEAFRRDLQLQRRLQYPNGNHRHLFVGARHFVTFLEMTGRLSAFNSGPLASSEPKLFVEFCDWMETHRGTTTATLNTYRLTLIDVLQTLGDQPAQYDARTLRAFILDRARRYRVGQAKTMVTALRMFLRFLSATGQCPPGLDHAIPTIARWRQASLPKYLSSEAVERVITSCDLTTLMGKRDRAILLLLARLGLRAGEVAACKFRDLDWAAGTVQVSGKTRRQNRLPLSQEIGDAILHYLDYRPEMDTPHVFLTTVAPFKGLSRHTVGQIATRAMHRAGVETPIYGAHVLRSSAATEMLRQGVSLLTIGDVLRHASMETTMGYTKVDLHLLKQMANPWPEDTTWL